MTPTAPEPRAVNNVNCLQINLRVKGGIIIFWVETAQIDLITYILDTIHFKLL